MKKSIFLFILCFAPAHAQLLQNISAKEILPDVESHAHGTFQQDAVLTAAAFVALTYQGFTTSMDIQTGKANGWAYRYYSPSLDSAMYFIGVKPALGGTQVLQVPVDTLSKNFPYTPGKAALDEPWADSPAALAGSKSGGAETFIQSHPDARIQLAVAVQNAFPNPLIPVGKYWLFRYLSGTDTLTCLVYGDTGAPFQCGTLATVKILSLPKVFTRVGELYEYDVNAAGSPAPVFSLPVHPTGMTIDSVSGVIQWAPGSGDLGVHDVTVRATNALGMDEQSFQVTVQAAATAPKITSTPVTETNASEAYIYQLMATGDPAPGFHLVRSPAGMMIDSGRGVIVWTPSRLQAGLNDVSVIARNSAGLDSQVFRISVFASPKFNQVPALHATVGTPFSATVSADGFPSPAYHLLSPPDGMSIDTSSGTFNWTPQTKHIGLDTIFVEARNRAGVEQIFFTILVDQSTGVSVQAPVSAFDLSPLYPNPVPASRIGAVRLSVTARTDISCSLVIHTLLGTVVRAREQMLLPAGTNPLIIPLNGLTPGVYCVRVSAVDGSSAAEILLVE